MSQNKSNKPILLLVDGHSLAFRSFYAFSKGGEGGLTTKDGFPTSVTYGFLKSLLDNCKSISPEGVYIAFDTEKPTFRHKLDPNYKANRDVAPDKFFQDIDQLEIILKESLNLPIIKSPGFEADDILGTIANDASAKGWQVNILSGDRDLFQLVDDKKEIFVLYMGGGPYSKSGNPSYIDEKAVEEKLGVFPDRVVDLKALTGDSSDNIPGVKGVGPKTAINLLRENNNLDGIYKALEQNLQKKDLSKNTFIKGSVIEKLKKDKYNAYLSKDLAKINLEVPLILNKGYELTKVSKESLSESLKRLELNSLLRQVDLFESTFSKGGFQKNKGSIELTDEKDNLENNPGKTNKTTLPEIQVNIIDNLISLERLSKRLDETNEVVAIDTETTSLSPLDSELVGIGISLCNEADDLFYVPIGHNDKNKKPTQLSIEEVFSYLKKWLEDPNKKKTLQNCKFDRQIFFNHGIVLNGVYFDTLLADYVLNNHERHGLSEMALREFGYETPSFKETVGKNKDFSFVDIKKASIYCGYDVFITSKLTKIFLEKFENNNNLYKLFSNIELPLEPILSQMETNGIKIDVPYLKILSDELRISLKAIEDKVINIAGNEFNLSSPKQLGEILFEILKLDKKKSRKTKTGYSTDSVVLEKLIDDHPIIAPLIEHRTYSKLLSTYIDALPSLVNHKTGRVHTNFNQAATATGRLSSSNPNLQNIPVRTEFSRRIRKAFIPEKGYKLISADYSQIELRILAHLAKEEILINAFHKNEDIHALTAKLIFEKSEINSTERRVGKTINFGVIYGMGVKKFARSTGVNIKEAKEFLIKYKNRYSQIFKFLELQERYALSRGYVETIFGRKREFKFDKNGLGRLLGKDPLDIDLKTARKAGMEAQSLRAAANAPIQGSSADIIKIAMIKLKEQIKNMDIPINLLLQVHDELLFEVPYNYVDIASKLIKKTMEDCVELEVPLLVDIGIGDNWMSTK